MKNNGNITGKTQLVFILGKSLAHSLSPQMQNAAFQAMKLPWVYAPLEIFPEGLEDFCGLVRESNVRGANVTVPYKENIISFLDRVEPEAEWLDSVNTLFRKNGKLWGGSTDGEGFLRSLGSRRKKLPGSKGLLLGSGGAAKAVAAALARSGIKGLFVANRSPRRAEKLIRLLRKKYPRLQAQAVSFREGENLMGRLDWAVQGTSLGLQERDPSPILLNKAKPGFWVIDLIYHRKTAFLREAQKRRLGALNGLGMLLHQGALSFERWTGRKAPLGVMESALLKHSP